MSLPRSFGTAAARPGAVSGKLIAPTLYAFFAGERAELSRQRVSPLRDRARAEKHHVIARTRELLHDRGQRFGSVERDHIAMAARAQSLYQRVAVDTGNRRLAGGIDRRDDDVIGVVEAGAELLEQVAQACVAVRLHDRGYVSLGGS